MAEHADAPCATAEAPGGEPADAAAAAAPAPASETGGMSTGGPHGQEPLAGVAEPLPAQLGALGGSSFSMGAPESFLPAMPALFAPLSLADPFGQGAPGIPASWSSTPVPPVPQPRVPPPCAAPAARAPREPTSPGGASADQKPPTACSGRTAGGAVSELEDLRVSTMINLVDPVTYSVGDHEATCQMLYLTNRQASGMSVRGMAKVRYALEIKEPKLVIHLMPSLFGQAYWRSFPFSAKRFPTKGRCEVSEGEAEKVEYQLMVFAKEVLLPLAMRTRALVVGSESCSLAAAFAAVSRPVQHMLGERCPFSSILFARAPALHISSRRPGTVASQFRKFSKSWQHQGFEEGLRNLYGEDTAFWPHEDILGGVSQCIIFESLTNEGREISEVSADRFQTDFITSLAEYLPVVALQTRGTPRMKYMTTVQDHVSRGLPLMLLDTRERGRKCRDLGEVAEERERLTGQLHGQGKKDEHIMSLMALVKSVLNQKYGAGAEAEGQPSRQQSDMWLWAAIGAAKLRKKDLAAPRPSGGSVGAAAAGGAGGEEGDSKQGTPQEDEEEHDLLRAASMVMEYAGNEEDWERRRLEEICEEAIQDVSASTGWQDFKDRWERNWIAIRSQAFFVYDDLRAFDAEYDWCTLHEHRDDTPNGRYMLKINPPGGERPPDHREAVGLLVAAVRRDFEGSKQYGLRHKTLKAILDQEEKWLAIYDILKNRSVETGNLFEVAACKEQIDALTRIERLPTEQGLETLVLLRCAWTLKDVFAEHARYYKACTKVAFLLFLLLSTAIVIVCTLSALYSEDVDDSTVVLVLSLALSAVAAWTTFLDPGTKWLHLRGGELALESEIWRFRTRIGEYAGFATLSVLARGESERMAVAEFQAAITAVRDKVLESASLKETSFYSVTTSTDDIYVDTETFGREQQHEHGRRGSMRGEQRQEQRQRQQRRFDHLDLGGAAGFKLTGSHRRHGQYDGGPLGPWPGRGEDNFHTPVGPHQYVRWRLMRELAFYQRRIPQCARRRAACQVLLLGSSIGATLLAALDLSLWTTIVAALASGLSAWQEFCALSKKLTRYSSTAESLGKLLVWWQSLGEADQVSVRHIEVLVSATEGLISSEQASWRSDTQKSLKELESLGAERDEGQKKAP